MLKCPSGLLLVLCLLALNFPLKKYKLGYKLLKSIEKINRLLFMDDLKVYSANDQKLDMLVRIVKQFSDEIEMNFGIDKCNKLTVIRGIPKELDNI